MYDQFARAEIFKISKEFGAVDYVVRTEWHTSYLHTAMYVAYNAVHKIYGVNYFNDN
jgi:hypothetical protein